MERSFNVSPVFAAERLRCAAPVGPAVADLATLRAERGTPPVVQDTEGEGARRSWGSQLRIAKQNRCVCVLHPAAEGKSGCRSLLNERVRILA